LNAYQPDLIQFNDLVSDHLSIELIPAQHQQFLAGNFQSSFFSCLYIVDIPVQPHPMFRCTQSKKLDAMAIVFMQNRDKCFQCFQFHLKILDIDLPALDSFSGHHRPVSDELQIMEHLLPLCFSFVGKNLSC